MNTSIHVQKIIPVYLACLCMAFMPYIFGIYLWVIGSGLSAFVIICIIDFLYKTSIRKNFGLVLITMLLAFITALLVNYIKFAL